VTAPQTRREQFLSVRRGEYLDAALRIVTTEGQRALTMQRVADELECAIGTIYRYFPSKDALLAEIQRAALETLLASFSLGQSQVEAFLASRSVDPSTAALTRVTAAARFWVWADETYPREMEFSRRLFTDPEIVVATEEAVRILPSAMQLLELGRQVLDAAVDVGALAPGNSIERAVVLISGLTGITLIAKFNRWGNGGIFDGHRHATRHLTDTLVAWGGDPGRLATVDELLVEFAEHGSIAPPVVGP
jgi:AcrR family transcriptional regulator